MIKFPCLCGVKFSLKDDMAGEMFQCKACGRLVTVPTLDDLCHIKEDGTYDIDVNEHAPTWSALETPQAPQQTGIPRDEQTLDYDLIGEAPRVAPRYDPFTGELIRPHEIIESEATAVAKALPSTQPLATSRYREVISAAPPMAWLTILGEMFMVRNITVMAVMIALHVFAACMLFFVMGLGAAFFIIIPLLTFVVCAGYYSIIVQETGPGEKDELPVPTRNFELRTDMWDPFVHMFIAVVLCLGPAALVRAKFADSPTGDLPTLALTILGAIFFPAVFLTAAVDGIIANFRPDRVVGVVIKSGFAYIPVVIAWTAGSWLVVNAMFGLYLAPVFLFGHGDTAGYKAKFTHGLTNAFLLLIAGLYLSYYAAWLLGTIWRKHHAAYPWIGQHFKKEKAALPTPPAPVPPAKTS